MLGGAAGPVNYVRPVDLNHFAAPYLLRRSGGAEAPPAYEGGGPEFRPALGCWLAELRVRSW